ncbi:hypothetical protein HanIR_Chr03g0123261 [Helianthus annuus]|nr:hypothetical protein HanIR_Chr03g0123261 [Helianthus annuus]
MILKGVGSILFVCGSTTSAYLLMPFNKFQYAVCWNLFRLN